MEELGDGRSIFEATSVCRQRLRECIDKPALMADEWSRKRLADFNLWASDSGALAKKRASLDQRLADKHTVREVILNLLSLLESLLARCQSLASETPGDGDEETELSQMLENVQDIMAQLVKISVAIRGAGLRARFERADDSFSPERHVQLKSHLEFLVLAASLEQDQKQRGNIHLVLSRNITDIAQRLIVANLLRRHRYLYARRRWTKQAAEHETVAEPRRASEHKTPSSQAQTPLASRPALVSGDEVDEPNMQLSAPSVITSTVPTAIQGPIQLPHEGRQLSATAPSSTSSKTVYPKPPKISEGAMFFRCPCCFQTLPVTFAKRSRWRKHLGEDIHPYTCILNECPKPLQLYLTRKEWAQHMREDHEVSKYWLCSACLEPTRFDLESHFDTHLRTQHGDVVEENQIPIFVSMSTYTSPPSLLTCPLCPPRPDDEEVEPDAILEHAAEHVHSFSLQSLPWPIPEEGEREYLGACPDDFLDGVNYFDIASDPASADDSWSSNSQESRDSNELGEASDLVFQDQNPDVPWEPYRGEEDSSQVSSDSPPSKMEDIAVRLATALKDNSRRPDTEPLIDILPGLTHEQIMELRREYKLLVRVGAEQKGVNIAKHIRQRLQPEDENLMKACYATALGRWESEAYWVNIWYHNDKVRHELLIEVLMGRTNNEIRLINDGFRDKKYGDSLTGRVRAELTEAKFKKLKNAVLLVLDGNRMEEISASGRVLEVDHDLVRRDVERLNEILYSNEDKETLILSIVTQRSDRHLREVLKLYTQTFGGVNFAMEAVKKTGDLVGAVLAHILDGVINKPLRDAMLLNHALIAPRRDTLRRVLLISRLVRYHWDSAYMTAVKEAYCKRYEKDLQEEVRDATTGSFGAFCEALCVPRVPDHVARGRSHNQTGESR